MSTNCTKCGKKPRLIGLLCKQCSDAEWDETKQQMIDAYEPLRTYFLTWAAHCGAPKDVFIGQTCRMIQDCWEIAAKKLESYPAPATRKVEDATGLELLQAMCANLEEDVLMALRFLYYVKAFSALPDDRYDQAERKFLARDDIDDSPLMNPGSDNADDYPERTRALGFYLMLVAEERRQKLQPSI